MARITERINIQRLVDSIQWSRKQLRPFREMRQLFIKEVIGANYNPELGQTERLVNLLKVNLDVYMSILAAAEPESDVSTPYRDLYSDSDNLKLRIDDWIKENDFGEKSYRFVMDAFFLIGIFKCGLTYMGKLEQSDVSLDVTEPFAELVDFDNWVHDATVKEWNHCKYMGDRYRVPLQDILDNLELYDKKVASELKPMPYKSTNESGEEKASAVSTRNDAQEEYIDHVELWDIWLPREGVILTLPADEGIEAANIKVLRAVEWEGPRHGPYSILHFDQIPSNLMPLSPMANLLGLHELSNMLYRKFYGQATRQKDIMVYQKGNSEDADTIRKAQDGDTVGIDGGSNTTTTLSLGGINQVNFAFAVHVNNLFKWLAGNLDTAGGLGTMAGTLGQEGLLNQNVNKRMRKLMNLTDKAISKVFQDIAYYLFYDPVKGKQLAKVIDKEIGLVIPVTFSNETVKGDYLQYNIDVRSFSMQKMSADERIDMVIKIVSELLIPLMPMLEAQHLQIDASLLVDSIARMKVIPELKNIIISADPRSQQKPRGEDDRMRQSPVTTRNYVRRGESSATPGGGDQQLMQSLMGGGVQPNRLMSQ